MAQYPDNQRIDQLDSGTDLTTLDTSNDMIPYADASDGNKKAKRMPWIELLKWTFFTTTQTLGTWGGAIDFDNDRLIVWDNDGSGDSKFRRARVGEFLDQIFGSKITYSSSDTIPGNSRKAVTVGSLSGIDTAGVYMASTSDTDAAWLTFQVNPLASDSVRLTMINHDGGDVVLSSADIHIQRVTRGT